MGCSPLGSSVHGDSPGKNTGVGCQVLQGIFLTQELTQGLLYCPRILYQLSYQGNLSIINLFHLMGSLLSVKQLKEYGLEYYLRPLRRN